MQLEGHLVGVFDQTRVQLGSVPLQSKLGSETERGRDKEGEGW